MFCRPGRRPSSTATAPSPVGRVEQAAEPGVQLVFKHTGCARIDTQSAHAQTNVYSSEMPHGVNDSLRTAAAPHPPTPPPHVVLFLVVSRANGTVKTLKHSSLIVLLKRFFSEPGKFRIDSGWIGRTVSFF